MTTTAIRVIGLLLAISCVSSCGWRTSNRHMAIRTPGAPLAHVPGKARVVFKKERFGYYSTSLWDVTDRAQPSLVAVLSPTMTAAHFVHPGQYFFLSINGGQRSLVRVTAAAEKTYCIYFRGNSLEPIKWGGTHPGAPTDVSVLLPTASEWANRAAIRDSVKRHTAKAYDAWSKLPQEERKRWVLETYETCRVALPSKNR